jgi:heterodisulfide reductase subunit C
MSKQIAFFLFFLIAMGVFSYTVMRYINYFKVTKKGFKVDRIGERAWITFLVAFGQTKILRRPAIGMLHALVWWGFIVITVGTAEMVIDGLSGSERIFGFLGPIYTGIVASGDIFAGIIILACIIFLYRRLAMHIKRFYGVEMNTHSKVDATIALSMILMLMVSLIGYNTGYVKTFGDEAVGYYPISQALASFVSADSAHLIMEFNWWLHIGLVLLFLNLLPYSKHFHVIMSVPNVFLSRLGPMTKMNNMEAVTKEVRLMMNPDLAFASPAEGEVAAAPSRFGIKDVEDVGWNNYVDSLACTHCGRCTSVCPANITGKLLSPRKILVDTRHRMEDKGQQLAKDASYDDGKSLVGDYITKEELWACTTCHACVQECPINIDHVSLIMDMRRYLVMEESAAPASLNGMFSNIENNGAPWQFSMADRMNWAENIVIRN